MILERFLDLSEKLEEVVAVSQAAVSIRSPLGCDGAGSLGLVVDGALGLLVVDAAVQMAFEVVEVEGQDLGRSQEKDLGKKLRLVDVGQVDGHAEAEAQIQRRMQGQREDGGDGPACQRVHCKIGQTHWDRKDSLMRKCATNMTLSMVMKTM